MKTRRVPWPLVLLCVALFPARAGAQLTVLAEERARSVALGTMREPRLYLDTASVQSVGPSVYRARFRLEHSSSMMLPEGLEGRFVREIHEKEIDCDHLLYRPMSRTLYDGAHRIVARADASQETEWTRPLTQSFAELEVKLFCASRWRTAKSG